MREGLCVSVHPLNKDQEAKRSKLLETTKNLDRQMPVVRVNLSQQTIDLLEELKKEHGLKTRSQALEMIIEELLSVPEDTNSEPEG